MAIKVKLRLKPITGNRHSLYLDFYPPLPHPKTGNLTRREFLGLYVFGKPINPIDKISNKETLQLAQQIRQKRENQINKPEVYSEYEKDQLKKREWGEQSFLEFFKQLVKKRTNSNQDNWHSAYRFLESFTNGKLKFSDLNERFCNDFKEYLLTTKSNKSSKYNLSQNSAHSYFNKFKTSLKQAYKDGYLQSDLNGKIESIKQVETQRNFLTLEELNALVKTDCFDPILKNAALFSALTGLRFSDIEKLVWGEIEFINDNGYFIRFKQKKTKGIETMPISEQAYSFLGDRKESDKKIFEDLTYSVYANKHLTQWISDAGIYKKITFHCFRHTFATLQLSLGTDIYTVSKLLGHRELKTTQIYAKIIDKTKREAADRIKLNINPEK